jgi:arylsulfatase A-like enzyme
MYAKSASLLLLGGLLIGPNELMAADIVSGNITTAIGPDFFFDDAATGGGDNNTTNFNRDINGHWGIGATVVLKGIGWASSASGTTATTATLTVTDLGPDDAFGTADDIVVGTITDNLSFAAASEYIWDFNSDITFTSTGTSIRINISSNGNIRRKTTSSTQQTQADVKLSLAGTASGGTPLPVTNTATASGNWDQITWNNESGNISGGVSDSDDVLIGSDRTVTYRGLPADERLSNLNLGQNSAAIGQGIFKITSGNLTLTENLTVGRNDPDNDSFVFATGGTLHVQGNAVFGRSTEACDGSLILGGGTVQIDGNLNMGAFEQGGSMLRFHNPGVSPAVQVGGTLDLSRCSLDLTYDSSYTHTPGQTIPLVTYAARNGQFANFRKNDEFNCGPNRFRINYDVGGNTITLTALDNIAPIAGRPNIIILFADDQGYSDLQLNGGTYADKFPMPRLQTIAEHGVRFTDAYVTGGVCHPSRCGLIGGQYQQRYGSDNNLGGSSYNGMSVTQRTMPNRLQELGYRTYGIGKWHLGDTVEYHPNLRGFDRWYGMWSGSRSFWYDTSTHNTFQDDMTPRPQDESNKEYLTDRIGDSCVNFIDEHLASDRADDPFFIYVSFTAVHGPVDIDSPPAPKPTDPRYARLISEFGLDASDYSADIVFGGSNATTVAKNRYDLAAMTLALDENIGKVLDKLNAEGLTSNTLVVYTNDNGGAGWSSGFGGNFSYNVPLRGYKGGSMTDGSIRVPCAAQWPGTIPSGQTVTDPIITLDWGATFVNASGGAPASVRNGLDGLDLMPLLRDGTPLPADRTLFWRASGVTGGGSAARMGHWKMLIDDPNGAPRLYDIRNNPAENNDLAASRPEILAQLVDRFNTWEARTLPPLYGSADTVLDTGLERHAIAGGLRMNNSSTTPLWQSSSLRNPVNLTVDFNFAFSIRASEHGPYPASAGIWHGLGDSTNRANLIRIGIDFGTSSLIIHEGKTGNSASTPLPELPTEFASATLSYQATTNTLALKLSSTSTSLVLNGSYGDLDVAAMGCATMEGEITTLRPIAAGAIGNEVSTQMNLGPSNIVFDLTYPTEPPFGQILERAPDLDAFHPEDDTLIESFGGGRYRATAPSSGLPHEFFRFLLD